jgi:hypothetical protein
MPTEGDRWVCTLWGTAHDYPPTNLPAFLEFAQSLPDATIYEAIKDAQPLTSVYGYRQTENRLAHFERMARWPERFVVVGDAVCTFNPTFGQGMSVAARGAMALDHQLRQQRKRHPNGDLVGLSRRFQKALARSVADPWLLATSEDSRWESTEGSRLTPMIRFMHWYMDQVLQLVPTSPTVYQVLLEATHMTTPPTALFRPHIVAQVLKHALRRTRGQPAATPSPLAPPT